MSKHGYELGVELSRVYEAGYKDLPGVADDYTEAWTHTPGACSGMTARGGGLGMDPGGPLDDLTTLLNDALLETASALEGVGKALVIAANHFAETDNAAKTELDKKKKELG